VGSGASLGTLCPQLGKADEEAELAMPGFDPIRSYAAPESRSAANPDFMLANSLSCRFMVWGSGCNSVNETA
jgi:hypothetical protein